MTSPELEAGMQSYPASLLASSGSRTRMTGGRARSIPATETSVQTLTAVAGAPGHYSPELAGADRPRNLAELAARTTADPASPWVAGEFVAIGVRGKRAHWSGGEWKGGESPGYAVPDPVEVVSSPAADDVSPPPADTQFPGDGNDTAADLHR